MLGARSRFPHLVEEISRPRARTRLRSELRGLEHISITTRVFVCQYSNVEVFFEELETWVQLRTHTRAKVNNINNAINSLINLNRAVNKEDNFNI
jgi:hypothetical protein